MHVEVNKFKLFMFIEQQSQHAFKYG